jgi:hypothetical protein
MTHANTQSNTEVRQVVRLGVKVSWAVAGLPIVCCAEQKHTTASRVTPRKRIAATHSDPSQRIAATLHSMVPAKAQGTRRLPHQNIAPLIGLGALRSMLQAQQCGALVLRTMSTNELMSTPVALHSRSSRQERCACPASHTTTPPTRPAYYISTFFVSVQASAWCSLLSTGSSTHTHQRSDPPCRRSCTAANPHSNTTLSLA